MYIATDWSNAKLWDRGFSSYGVLCGNENDVVNFLMADFWLQFSKINVS